MDEEFREQFPSCSEEDRKYLFMSVTQLPCEVLQLVLELLPPKQVAGACGLVCRSWRDASQDPSFWYRCFERWWHRRAASVKGDAAEEPGSSSSSPLFPQLLSEAGVSQEEGLHFEPSAPWKNAFLQIYYTKHISINEQVHKDKHLFGLAFNVVAHANVTLTRLSFFSHTSWTQPLGVQVYYHPEGLKDHQYSEGWLSVFEAPLSVLEGDQDNRVTLPQPLNLKLLKGSTTALYIHTSSANGISYTQAKSDCQVGDVVLAGPHLSLTAGFYYASPEAFKYANEDQVREFAGRIEYFVAGW